MLSRHVRHSIIRDGGSISPTAWLYLSVTVALKLREGWLFHPKFVQHIAMIRFNRPEQGKLMAWYLKSDYGQQDLLKNKRGGGKLGLGFDDIRDTPVPVPKDTEADRKLNEIESRLSVCYSIEEAVEHEIKEAHSMKRSILKEAFEGRL